MSLTTGKVNEDLEDCAPRKSARKAHKKSFTRGWGKESGSTQGNTPPNNMATLASSVGALAGLNGAPPNGKEDIVPSKTAVLERFIPWEGYQRVGLVAPKDFELISVYDKKGITEQERNALLDSVCVYSFICFLLGNLNQSIILLEGISDL